MKNNLIVSKYLDLTNSRIKDCAAIIDELKKDAKYLLKVIISSSSSLLER